MHWLAQFFGFNAGAGAGVHYLFWSGAGSDFGELAMLGWLAAFYRKHQCEVQPCWRLGRHGTAAGHSVCRRHHPDGKLTAAAVADAHAAAKRD